MTSAPSKTVPEVAGKSFPDVRNTLVGAGIVYEAVGNDGVKFTGIPMDTSKVLGSDPAAGGQVQDGGKVTLKIDGTQAQSTSAANAKEAARKRAVRYDFRCSTTGSAIGASDNQLFNSPQQIWAAPSFSKFKSCDLRVGGT